MSVCFQNFSEMQSFLEQAGIKIKYPRSDKHFIIIGHYTGRPIGCTSDRLSILFEEPEATFQEVEYDACPIHNSE